MLRTTGENTPLQKVGLMWYLNLLFDVEGKLCLLVQLFFRITFFFPQATLNIPVKPE